MDQGQADQDRREGSHGRYVIFQMGRGRHRTANVPRDFAADRGATAAVATGAGVRCSMSCIQEQPTEGVRPNARENGQIRPSTIGLPELLVAIHTSRQSCCKAGKARIFTPVRESSGESRLMVVGGGGGAIDVFLV